MLEIVKFKEDEYDFPCLLVLGCFDGLHAGHSELIKKAKLQAKINGLDLGIMMFENGKDGKDAKLLYSFEERVAIAESFNAKFILKIDYNDAFKQISPLEFLSMVEDHLNVKAYMSGKDFRFGKGAKGKSSTLKSYAEDEENGVWYMPIKDVLYEGEKISTTEIKSLLASGDIKKANMLLGRNYSVSGEVIHGADRGQSVLGFPTLNLQYPEHKAEVKKGVYTVKCNVGGNEYYGIANYGSRPTFGEENDLLEVYLDGFDGTLYGETLTVGFISYIRDIQKFDSPEQLSAQLSQDLLLAKAEAEVAAAEKEPAHAEQVTPVETVTHTEEVTPVEEVKHTEEVVPVEETTPTEEIANIEEPASTEEVAPVDELAVEEPAEAAVPIEEDVPVEEPAEVQEDTFEAELNEEAEDVTVEESVEEVKTEQPEEDDEELITVSGEIQDVYAEEPVEESVTDEVIEEKAEEVEEQTSTDEVAEVAEPEDVTEPAGEEEQTDETEEVISD